MDKKEGDAHRLCHDTLSLSINQSINQSIKSSIIEEKFLKEQLSS